MEIHTYIVHIVRVYCWWISTVTHDHFELLNFLYLWKSTPTLYIVGGDPHQRISVCGLSMSLIYTLCTVIQPTLFTLYMYIVGGDPHQHNYNICTFILLYNQHAPALPQVHMHELAPCIHDNCTLCRHVFDS